MYRVGNLPDRGRAIKSVDWDTRSAGRFASRHDGDRDGIAVVAPSEVTAARDTSLSRHILPSSGTLVGVCATLIGLVKIVETKTGPTHVDEFAAMAALIFLTSAIASYISMRHPQFRRLSRRCELAADYCFMAGLVAIVLIALLFAYEIV